MARAVVESNLTFAGFLVFSCPAKKDAKQVNISKKNTSITLINHSVLIDVVDDGNVASGVAQPRDDHGRRHADGGGGGQRCGVG